jgi:hypothetical protein
MLFVFYNYILHFILQYIISINKCKLYLVILRRYQLYIKALLSQSLKMASSKPKMWLMYSLKFVYIIKPC